MAVYDATRAEPEDFVSQVGTLNGNHVACAAGLATLAELRKPGAYERAARDRTQVAGGLGGPLQRG